MNSAEGFAPWCSSLHIVTSLFAIMLNAICLFVCHSSNDRNSCVSVIVPTDRRGSHIHRDAGEWDTPGGRGSHCR